MTFLIRVFFLFLFINTTHSQIFSAMTNGEIYNDTIPNFGVSFGDYNNDGYPDIYGTAKKLYHNNGDGTFTKVLDGVISQYGSGFTGTWGDFDNNGFLDLFISKTLNDQVIFFQNNGNDAFDMVIIDTLFEQHDFQGCSWVDIENDGDLDIYIVAGGSMGEFNNSLYINNDGIFLRDTANIITKDSSRSSNCSWSDYNNDGFIDLYLANRSASNSIFNNLYQNNGDGTFTQILDGAIVQDSISSFGSSWGDYNNDGYLDLFVTNQFQDKLYRNNGDNTFTSIDSGELTNDSAISTGSNWIDFDNDGDLDILVSSVNSNNKLFENNGDETFSKVVGEQLTMHHGLSNSWADWDKDGDLDVIISRATGGRSFPYINNGNDNNWININCLGNISNALGSKIWVLATINGVPTWQVRELNGQTGLFSQNNQNAHFGLGPDGFIDSIRIEWRNGITQKISNVPTNVHLEILEDISLSTNKKSIETFLVNFNIYPNPAHNIATIELELNEKEEINISIIDLLGKVVKEYENKCFLKGKNIFNLNSLGLSKGNYFIKLQAGNKAILTKKFVVQ